MQSYSSNISSLRPYGGSCGDYTVHIVYVGSILSENVLPASFDRYKTDFYVLHRYPSAIRPFYTMPCWDDKRYSNSFDVFIRGATYFYAFSGIRHYRTIVVDQRTKK